MKEKIFGPSPVEPAHPMVVKHHEDLVTVYNYIRENFQVEIDKAFDRISREIGYVVATALPFTLEVGGDGRVKGGVIIDGKQLQGSIFDRELTQALAKFGKDQIPAISEGVYQLYLFWFDALQLKLRTDWMEPAHVGRVTGIRQPRQQVVSRDYIRRYDWLEPAHFSAIPGVMEPAHWFDPGIAFSEKEAVLITAIDKVYPELKLVDRIASSREAGRMQVRSEVQEPAHFRQIQREILPEQATQVLAEMATLLRRFGY